MKGLSALLRSRSKLQDDMIWALSSFGLLNVIRFGLNICLTWLLNPAIFGIMTIISTFRTGVELLSDVGVGQSIVISRNGEEPSFLRTAWSIQLMRGAILFAVGLGLCLPIQWLYGTPGIAGMIAVSSSIFLLTGLFPPTRFLLQRNRSTRVLSLAELATAAGGAVITLIFAYLLPSAWGMVWAAAISSVLALLIMAFLYRGPVLRVAIDSDRAREILRFGRWIFLSSLIYFASTNLDRVYLPTAIPLTLFGVYGISRALGDMGTQLMQRLGEMIIFPAIAKAGQDSIGERAARVGRLRLAGLAPLTAAIAAGIAGGDLFVRLVYDDRYAAAQVMLPLLMGGTWFAVQAAMGEAVLLGLSAPARAAAGNAAKFGWTAILLPLALHWHGAAAAVAVIALADLPRYVMLAIGQQRAGLGFWRQDLLLILVGIALMLLFRACLVEVGAVDGMISTGQWRELAALSR